MESNEMGLVLFISRGKDNENVAGFKQRTYQFLTKEPANSGILKRKFKKFVEKGEFLERSRFYYSVNKRDRNKTKRALLHYLIDHDDLDLGRLDNLAAGISAKPENKAENKWMLDLDIDFNADYDDYIKEQRKLNKLLKCVIQDSGDENIVDRIIDTPNGYHIIVKHGFDTRNILDKYPNLELKRDDFYLVDTGINETIKSEREEN